MVFLARDELAALTRRRNGPAQVRVLRHLGIEHKIRPDGSVVVLRAHVEAALGGQSAGKEKDTLEPNWAAI